MKIMVGNRKKNTLKMSQVELISAAVKALPEEYRNESSYFAISVATPQVVVCNLGLPPMTFDTGHSSGSGVWNTRKVIKGSIIVSEEEV
jgi:hypothetical protein